MRVKEVGEREKLRRKGNREREIEGVRGGRDRDRAME